MKRAIAILFTVVLLFSLASCKNKIEFEERDGKTVVMNKDTEYTLVGVEGSVWCFGEWSFLAHVKGEKKSFYHLGNKLETGMYTVNGTKDVLVRYTPDNEFAAIYVKSELLKKELTASQCVRFGFVKGSLSDMHGASFPKNGITECERFLGEIKSGPKAIEAGLYDLVRQPDGTLDRCYVYGYACGVVQEELNVVIPMEIMSFDDKAYSIQIEGEEYVLPQEWLDRLTSA